MSRAGLPTKLPGGAQVDPPPLCLCLLPVATPLPSRCLHRGSTCIKPGKSVSPSGQQRPEAPGGCGENRGSRTPYSSSEPQDPQGGGVHRGG